MQQYITPDRMANAIRQDTNFKGHYLIVEGIKDLKFYSKFIPSNTIRLRAAFGNSKVRKVLTLLDNHGFDRRLGIIDSDFNDILNISETIDGLFVTDNHDIEVMIIQTKALENVLYLFCSKAKIENFEKLRGASIRDLIYSLGEEIAYLKLANKIHNLGLVFKPLTTTGNTLKYDKFTCTKTLNFLGKDKLIKTVIDYSRNRDTTTADSKTIENKLLTVSQNKHNILDLANGHDLANFIFLLVKKVLKSKNKMLADYNSIEDSLILAYEYKFFKNTILHNTVNNWANNRNFVVFKE